MSLKSLALRSDYSQNIYGSEPTQNTQYAQKSDTMKNEGFSMLFLCTTSGINFHIILCVQTRENSHDTMQQASAYK